MGATFTKHRLWLKCSDSINLYFLGFRGHMAKNGTLINVGFESCQSTIDVLFSVAKQVYGILSSST